jgi:hypothetical protein
MKRQPVDLSDEAWERTRARVEGSATRSTAELLSGG